MDDELINISEIVAELTAEILSPCTFVFGFAYQLNETLVLASSVNPTGDPLHMVMESSDKSSKGGLTVTAIVCASPAQFPFIERGVTL